MIIIPFSLNIYPRVGYKFCALISSYGTFLEEFENCKWADRTGMYIRPWTEIVKSEDRQDHGQQKETKDKYGTHNTTLKTKAGVT